MCVNADADELKPLLTGSLNETGHRWAASNNHTVLDTIFQWRDRVENDTSSWDEDIMYGRPGKRTIIRSRVR
jgi:hypothetical protein